MNKTRENKRTLTTSAIVLLLCIVALIGATAAWFTSTASNTGNRIQAGTLKVDLLMDKTLNESAATDYVSIAGGTGDIFKEATVAQNSNVTLWEPGKTQIVYLAVENAGNLALKYNAYIDVTDEGLVGALEYALFDEGTYAKMKAAGYTDWAALKAVATVSGDVAAGRSVISTGVLDEITKGTQNERDYVALAVHMKEAAGNEYQGKDAIIDVAIVATQLASENDGFGTNTYDSAAAITEPSVPIHSKATSPAVTKDTPGEQVIAFVPTERILSANLPASAVKELIPTSVAGETVQTGEDVDTKLHLQVETVLTTPESVTYEIGLSKTSNVTDHGSTVVKRSETSDVHAVSEWLTAEILLGDKLENVNVFHSDVAMEKLASASATPTIEAGGFFYDSSTGHLTIKSKTFSPFKVTYNHHVVNTWALHTDTSWYTEQTKTQSVFTLSTADQVAGLAAIVNAGTDNFAGKTIKIAADMDLSAHDWVPIGNGNCSFLGNVDGQTHTINGLHDGAYDDLPLSVQSAWGTTEGAKNSGIAFGFVGTVGSKTGEDAETTILYKDLKFTNVNLDNEWSNMMGAVVGADTAAAKIGSSYINGSLKSSISFDNITVSGSVNSNNTTGVTASGVAGKLYTKGALSFKDCTNNAAVFCQGVSSKAAGIVGYAAYFSAISMNACSNTGDILVKFSQANYMAAGLATLGKSENIAANTITFSSVTNSGNIYTDTSETVNIGGLVSTLATKKDAWVYSLGGFTGKVYAGDPVQEKSVPEYNWYGHDVKEKPL